MNWARAIRTLRKQRNLRQLDLAQRACVSDAHISYIESGERKPSLVVLEAIAIGLQVPLLLIVLLASDDHDLMGADPEPLGAELLKTFIESRK